MQMYLGYIGNGSKEKIAAATDVVDG